MEIPFVEKRTGIVSALLQGERLDKCLCQLWPDLSRTRLQNLLERGMVLLNGMPVTSPSLRLKEVPCTVVLHVPPAEPLAVEAQAADLEIHYEDDSLLVLCKPAGMVVHPAAGNPDHTLVNAILAHCQGQLSGIGGVQRPGIVHRLDKDTSGLMVIAKNDAAHHSLTHQFHERQVERAYQAIVWGTPAVKEGMVEAPIARHPRNRQKMAVVASGKPAATRWKVLEKASLATLVECRLLSGRTHQVRVHMQHLGFPLVGDPLYGKKKLPSSLPPVVNNFSRQALHARTLGFHHPETGEWLCFERPPPEDFAALWAVLADKPA